MVIFWLRFNPIYPLLARAPSICPCKYSSRPWAAIPSRWMSILVTRPKFSCRSCWSGMADPCHWKSSVWCSPANSSRKASVFLSLLICRPFFSFLTRIFLPVSAQVCVHSCECKYILADSKISSYLQGKLLRTTMWSTAATSSNSFAFEVERKVFISYTLLTRVMCPREVHPVSAVYLKLLVLFSRPRTEEEKDARRALWRQQGWHRTNEQSFIVNASREKNSMNALISATLPLFNMRDLCLFLLYSLREASYSPGARSALLFPTWFG